MNTFQKKEIQNMVVLFPEDVIIDILLRLPSKSLSRSRCVSKYWNTLITSPSFIKAHLHRASKLCHLICQESKHTELMMHHLSRGGGCHYMTEEDDEEELSVSKLKMRFSGCCEFSNLDPHPAITDGFNNFKLVDSFNGIICLYAVNKKASTSRIWLWNPAINDCFVVPEPRFPISSAKSYCVGFGFNTLTRHLGDYKVVNITLYYEGDDENCSSSKAEIYSRRTNSWKEHVGWFPNSSYIGSPQLIFEEYICWSYYDRRWSGDQCNVTKSIVSFNMVSEEFHSMALPDSIPSDDNCSFTITLLDGCVSLLAPYKRGYSRGYEVWTMKEFGNILSWNKLYRFKFFGRIISVPLGFASTDEALFLTWFSYGLRHASNKEIHSYDTRTMTLDERKTISFDHAVKDCCLKLYVESLIPVSYISRLDEGRSSDE